MSGLFKYELCSPVLGGNNKILSRCDIGASPSVMEKWEETKKAFTTTFTAWSMPQEDGWMCEVHLLLTW